jgi:hypothetical protein
MILYYVACDANTVVVDDDRTRVPMSFVTQTTQSTTVPTPTSTTSVPFLFVVALPLTGSV